jgi:hypothetical protein
LLPINSRMRIKSSRQTINVSRFALIGLMRERATLASNLLWLAIPAAHERMPRN